MASYVFHQVVARHVLLLCVKSVGELEVDIIVERICPFCLAFEALRRLVGTIRGTWMVAPIGIGSSRKAFFSVEYL